MFTTIRHYQDEAPDIIEQIKPHADELRALISGIPGFVAYYLIDTGGGSLATVSIFADQFGAEESNRAAAKFVRDTGLVDRGALPNPATIVKGEVTISV